MRNIIVVILIVLSLTSPFKARAQEDPGLATMVVGFTLLAEKELKSQEAAMTLQTAGHLWTAEEWEKTTDIQKQYNDYLESFRDVVAYSAQIYGFYQEVDRMAGHIKSLNSVIKAHPAGVFAGALSVKRNQVYREIIYSSLDIVNDLRMVCFSDIKMTETERAEIIFGIRPKLRKMNAQLTRLIRVVKYSSFTDIMIDIELLERKKTDKKAITKACLAKWKRRGGMK